MTARRSDGDAVADEEAFQLQIELEFRDSATDSRLPDGVPVIRKGRAFGDDLTDALTRFGIL